MTWDTVNVLTIPWAGEIAGKLAGKILDVLEMYQVGTGWVHYPFPCSVLAMYRLGTPPLAPSDSYQAKCLERLLSQQLQNRSPLDSLCHPPRFI